MLDWIKCSIKKTFFNISVVHRNLNKNMFPYSRIQELKSSFDGKRCFIICTGPSLTREDVLLLKDEYTFGMNSICKLMEEINWAPTFFGIQDEKVYEKLKDNIEITRKAKYRFTSGQIYKKYQLDNSWIPYPLDRAYHMYKSQHKQQYYAKFSDDCYKRVYNGYSITYSLIQIAVYLGFKEIYIIGADNSYSKTGSHHFIETGHVSKDAYIYTDKFNAGYVAAKEFADAHDVKIINVTRGGALEVFPRKTLEEVLNN